MKGSGDKGFPVLDSRTSGLHVGSRDVSIYCMAELWRILLPLKISLFQTANQKLIQKSHVPRALRFSCQGPAGLREAKRAMGPRVVEWSSPHFPARVRKRGPCGGEREYS